jgi:hypothetical protein
MSENNEAGGSGEGDKPTLNEEAWTKLRSNTDATRPPEEETEHNNQPQHPEDKSDIDEPDDNNNNNDRGETDYATLHNDERDNGSDPDDDRITKAGPHNEDMPPIFRNGIIVARAAILSPFSLGVEYKHGWARAVHMMEIPDSVVQDTPAWDQHVRLAQVRVATKLLYYDNRRLAGNSVDLKYLKQEIKHAQHMLAQEIRRIGLRNSNVSPGINNAAQLTEARRASLRAQEEEERSRQ